MSSTPGQVEYVPFNTTEIDGPSRHYWLIIIILVFAPLGLIGNTTVLWLLGFRIRRNPFSVYILNLAAADSLFLGSVVLIYIQELFWMFTLLYIGMLYITYVTYFAGLNLLAAISTERCLSVLYPIWYKCRRPKNTSAMVCALIWALSVLLVVIYQLSCKESINRYFCPSFITVPAVWFSLLTLTLCMSSLTLLVLVQCHSRRRQPPRLYCLVLLNVLVFLLCGLPLGVDSLLPSFDLFYKSPWLPPILAFVNSSVNPFIYFLLGSQRRRRGREPLRMVLQRALGVEEELGDGIRDTGHNNTLEMSS